MTGDAADIGGIEIQAVLLQTALAVLLQTAPTPTTAVGLSTMVSGKDAARRKGSGVIWAATVLLLGMISNPGSTAESVTMAGTAAVTGVQSPSIVVPGRV